MSLLRRDPILLSGRRFGTIVGVELTLLYFDGCPHWRAAEDNVRLALAEVGKADVDVRREVVDTIEKAERVGFLGSPTILVNGNDPFATPGAAPGLSCRMYRTDTGMAGSPTVAQLRLVLATAQ
jgi:hypothetical protein